MTGFASSGARPADGEASGRRRAAPRSTPRPSGGRPRRRRDAPACDGRHLRPFLRDGTMSLQALLTTLALPPLALAFACLAGGVLAWRGWRAGGLVAALAA